MKRPFVTSLVVVLLALPLATAGVLPVEAQNYGNSYAAPGVPQGYSVLPPDLDRGDDQIIQLNNLTIQGFSSNVLPATIYASRDTGISCLKYGSTTGYGRSYPCPPVLAPTVLYQIQVNPETILLLRNRNRASLSTFEVGDRINVFGFFDADAQYMQALIVRDLDKPGISSGGSQYVQMNSMVLISEPSAAYPPAVFAVADKGVPCWYYSGPAGYRTSSGNCPIPTTGYGAPQISGDAQHLMPYPSSRVYTVQVTSVTNFLDVNRRRISLAEFHMGDVVNIFGRYNSFTNTVEVITIRDLGLSDPVPNPGNASLTVEVRNRVHCLMAPCNPIPEGGAKVELRPSGTGGPTMLQIADSSGRTYFNGLQPGNYSVTAYGSNRTASANVVLAYGKASYVSLELGSTISSQAIRIISPNGGENLVRGEVGYVRWNTTGFDPAYDTGTIYLTRETQSGDTAASVRYEIGRQVSFSEGEHTYSWRIGTVNTSGSNVPSGGGYFIEVCASNSSICDKSDASFSISDVSTALRLDHVSPAAAPVGSTVTLHGSGFTSSENVIYMNGVRMSSLPSYDGRAITYSNVGQPAWYCPPGLYCATVMPQPLPPGNYEMWVTNVNGTSNKVNFYLQPGYTY